MSDHFYTIHPTGENAPNYAYEGDVGFVFPAQAPETIALNRYFNPHIGDHLYTTDLTEGAQAVQAYGYVPEGVAAYVYPVASTQVQTQPLYRWFNGSDHFYCLDPKGEIGPANGYRAEGVACKVLVVAVAGSVPFHRWFNAGPMNFCVILSTSTGEVVAKRGIQSVSAKAAEIVAPGVIDAYNNEPSTIAAYKASHFRVAPGKC